MLIGGDSVIMATNVSSLQEERTITEIRRLTQSGLDARDLLRRIARALNRVVPADAYAAATIDPASNLIVDAFAEQLDGGRGVRPVHRSWFEHFYFEETYAKTLALAQRKQAVTTLMEETHGRLERSLCYRESMRPGGIEHKAHAVFVDRHLWGDMELYRSMGSPGFSTREIGILDRIAPLVGAGLKFAALRSQSMDLDVNESMPGVLVVDAGGNVSGTPSAEALLQELGDLHPHWREADHAPVAVQVVLGALHRSLMTDTAGEQDLVPRVRLRGRAGRWLALHAACSEATETRPAERLIVISPVSPQEMVWLGVSAYGLSAREEDVIKLVVGGLSTKQISDRLFIAEHTVQRHLSNIFEKVGVRSRRELVKELFFERLLPSAGVA
jgi:DNA-binding CsgD family transcriptional regulator